MKNAFIFFGVALLFMSGSFGARAEGSIKPPLYTVKIPLPYNDAPTDITICSAGDSSSAGGPELYLVIDDNVPVIKSGGYLPAPGDCKQFPLTIPAQQVVSNDITVKLKPAFPFIDYTKIGSVKFGSVSNLQVCALRIYYTYNFFSFGGSAGIECMAASAK